MTGKCISAILIVKIQKGLTKVSYGLRLMDYATTDEREYVYIIDACFKDGGYYIAGIKKEVKRDGLTWWDYECINWNAKDNSDGTWSRYVSEAEAVEELLNNKALKTMRKRRSESATTAWLEKLPLDEKVEL